jgi:hypothetical protein
MKKQETRMAGKCSSAFVALGMAMSMTWAGQAQAIPTNGLAAWFKADSIGLANGATVTSWSDSSPGNNAGTATKLGGSPTYNTGTAASGNEPYVTLAADSLFRSANNLGISGDFSASVFVVYRPVSDTAANGVFGLGNIFGGTAHAFGMLNNFSGNRLQMQLGSSTAAYFTDNETTNFQIVQVDKSPGPINTTTKMWWDGQSLPIQAGSSTATPNLDDKPLNIGVWGYNGPGTAQFFFNGDIAEIIVYNGALSSNDAWQVVNTLGDKYDITVPEPTAAAFMGWGVIMLLWHRRRIR